MSCKHCGSDCVKSVETQELQKELARRMSEANEARENFFKAKWPRKGLSWMLPMLTIMAWCILAAGLTFSYKYSSVEDFYAWFGMLGVSLFCFIVLSLVLRIWYDRKFVRFQKEFESEHPQHAEALPHGYYVSTK